MYSEMQIIILIFFANDKLLRSKQAIYATFQNFKDKFFRYLPVAVIWGSGNAISLVTTLKHFYFGARPGGRREVQARVSNFIRLDLRNGWMVLLVNIGSHDIYGRPTFYESRGNED